MKIGRLRSLFLPLLLLWGMDFGVDGEEAISNFIKDVMAAFQLTSPTIVYDSEEPPEICFNSQWVLCMPLQYQEETDSEDSGKFAIDIFKNHLSFIDLKSEITNFRCIDGFRI